MRTTSTKPAPRIGLLVAGLMLATSAAASAQSAAPEPSVAHEQPPVKIILDTDFGDDGDDLAALSVLHHLADLGEVELLAVGQSNSRWDAPAAIDVINTYYGRLDIPIGQVPYEVHEGNQYSSFLVKRYEHDLDDVLNAVEVYRQALADAPDQSVTFVVIGFKWNMRDLLASEPDAISPLSGIELVRQKVKLVSDMGGGYPSMEREFNFSQLQEGGVAREYVEDWPTPMIFSGDGTGDIYVGKQVRKTDTPVGRALDHKLKHGWTPGEKAQSAFDLAAVLVAARGADRYFNTRSGCNHLDDDGSNTFAYDEDCGHSHVDARDRKVSFKEIGDMFEEMMLAEPMLEASTPAIDLPSAQEAE